MQNLFRELQLDENGGPLANSLVDVVSLKELRRTCFSIYCYNVYIVHVGRVVRALMNTTVHAE